MPTNCSKLTSLCNWDSLFVFLPKYMCLSLLFNFLTSHTCHLITTFVVLTLDFAEFVLLPRTSCFLVAYTPSCLKHLIFSATYMSPYLFRLLCSVQYTIYLAFFPILLCCLDAFPARYTSEVHLACLVALNVSLRLHTYVLFILREQRLSNYEF